MDGTFLATILAALIGALAGIGGTYLTGRQSREIERQRMELEMKRTEETAEQTIQLEQQKHKQALELERQRLTQELRAEYDKDLLQHRIAAYQALWKITGRFPLYGKDTPVTIQVTQQLTIELRKWYFEEGGIFFTEASRDAYFALQKRVKQILEEELRDQPSETELPFAIYGSIQEHCSALRSKLVEDVGTRRYSEVN
jgi:hypothetical protein